ncbi:MAG: metallophosphoesterase [Bacteroidales bacterium]|nr:metallophosphoesterase [Bacteroidales bacterium]
MKKLNKILLLCVVLTFGACSSHEKAPFPKATDYNFFVVSDMGMTGNLSPIATAKEVSFLADSLKPRFIINSGDMFHNSGVKDTADQLWTIGFEDLFEGKSLNLDFYGTLGNHEYYGNPQALVDYSLKGGRWKMPARYYTLVKTINETTTLRIIVLDTSPFLESYRKKPAYKEVLSQDTNRQVAWLDSVLQSSHETWKIVVGHHPVYSSIFGDHGDTKELIKQVDPLMHKYGVDYYFAGHVHTFQHNEVDGIDYIVTTSGCKKRFSNPWYYTVFDAKSLGFTLCSITPAGFRVSFINEKGEEIYSYRRKH